MADLTLASCNELASRGLAIFRMVEVDGYRRGEAGGQED